MILYYSICGATLHQYKNLSPRETQHSLSVINNSDWSAIRCLIMQIYTVFCAWCQWDLTSFPHGPPACDVALCSLQETVHWWGETHWLDGVGHGCWDCQLQKSHVVVHVSAIESWVDDDSLDGDDQGSHTRAQHRSQAHSPVSGARVTGGWSEDSDSAEYRK